MADAASHSNMNPNPDPTGGPTPSTERAATTLVVIDDDPNVLRATARIVAEAGYTVLTGATAAEALELTRRHMPAMLLLDVVLPDGNGMDVARQLKSEAALAGVFVILLSGFKTTGEDQAAGLATGLADGYISLPFSKPEFLARIDALLRLRAMQELLREALREKEALLNEVHHRVKNNLQVISSLLSLEAHRHLEPATKAVLNDMKGRIRSMALLHETLCRSGTFAVVDLGAYVSKLAAQAFQALTTQASAIQLHLELVAVHVEKDQAMTCGLLVNELLTNSLKHAFPGGARGEIRVGLEREAGGRVRLQVSDTGVGLPADFDLSRANTLGLQLVSDLTQQLRGVLEIGPGASFSLVFTPKACAGTVFPLPPPGPGATGAATRATEGRAP
jgi:two-component sensor histidine kinase